MMGGDPMILCFSGTGNSRHAARILADMLDDEVVDVNSLMKGKERALPSERAYVVVAPVYGWRMPRVLGDFLARSQLTPGMPIYFVLTCGSGMGNAGAYARKLSEDLGLTYMGAASVPMPENYVALFPVPDPRTARGIIRRAEPRIRALGARILRGEPLPSVRKTPVKSFLSGPMNVLFYQFIIGAKKFRTTDQCVGCGWCARACPLNNIILRESRPVWANNCTHCMACICGCPEEAIEYGRRTVGKNRHYIS